jgi:hypothetical protein
MLVDGGVGRKLGVKRGGENAALAHEHGVAGIFCEDFDFGADRLDDGRADENHLERLRAEFRGRREDVARKLAAVAIAQHRNIENPERGLRRPVYAPSEENRAGTGAEERAAVRGKFSQGEEEAFLGDGLEMRAALAAGKNHSIEVCEITWGADEGMRDAKTSEHFGVGFEVTLD